jgi:radical SAM protein with 4Fe4S-binding SPASM domain
MKLTKPLYVVWEITNLCNLRCLHCYSAADVPHPDEFTTDEALDVIDQLADAGTIVLALSGGEPLLRKDWRDLVRHATARGLLVSIGTNGSPVTPQLAAELAKLHVESVCVSIDGADAATHETVRPSPGSFEKATRAVRLLRAEGVRTIVGFTPVRHNFRQSEAIIDLAFELGASAVNLSEFVPTGRGSIDLCLRPEELRPIIETWARRKGELAGRMDVYWHDCRVGEFLAPEERAKYIGCGAGVVLARITYNGKVAPCVTLPLEAGDLRRQGFQEIWDTSPLLGRIRDRTNIATGNCSRCDKLATCGGCRAVSNGFTGDAFAGDPYCWIIPEPEAWEAVGLPLTPVGASGDGPRAAS